MLRPAAITFALLTLLTSCERGQAAAPQVPAIVVTIHTSERNVVIADLRLANTDAARQRGLMGVTQLSEFGGMVFLWDQPVTGGAFWMKDTPIPLSVIFWDPSGKIYAEFDMQPCTQNPCRLYKPGGIFAGAIEMRQGEFAKLGIGIGDTIDYHLAPR